MIDDKFVNAIAGLAQKAATSPTMAVSGENDSYFWLWDQTRQQYVRKPKARHRLHRMGSLASLVALAQDKFPNAEIWYSFNGVTLRFTDQIDGERKGMSDLAHLGLSLSKPMATLLSWDQTTYRHKQDQASVFLRTLFRDCVIPDTLASTIANISWAINEKGESAIGHGTRSVGRSLEAKLEGRTAIPEVVVFKVPMWHENTSELGGVIARVSCVLDVDPQSQTVAFIPVTGSIQENIARAERDLAEKIDAHLRARFSDSTLPNVYQGELGTI